jgi:4-aminobutyrate aminotransferase-like enzyme
VDITPGSLTHAFILTTGAEATECAIKLAKTWGLRHGGSPKRIIVSYDESFHGRTMGAQLAGGVPTLKEWIGKLDSSFVQLPHPGSNITFDKSFNFFERRLAELGIKPENVAGIISETYQGANCGFFPDDYAVKIREWCNRHNIVFIFDEVQAGFGRTGKMWGFEHHGIVPDLICLGKGISSSLPVAAVVGRKEIMNQYGPGSMTSTHSGHPLGCVASLASIELIERENLVENACIMGERLLGGLQKIQKKHSTIFDLQGRGLVFALMALKERVTYEPDGDLAFDIIQRCYEAGLLMFAPVGRGGGCVKISPPLCINTEAIDEGLEVLSEAVDEAITAQKL